MWRQRLEIVERYEQQRRRGLPTSIAATRAGGWDPETLRQWRRQLNRRARSRAKAAKNQHEWAFKTKLRKFIFIVMEVRHGS